MTKVEMAFSAIEKSIDGGGNCTGATVPYIVFGASSEDDALAAVKAAAPSSMGFGAGNAATLASIGIDERVNATTFRVTASYEARDSPSRNPDGSGGEEDQAEDFSFETGGGTRHVLQGKGTRRYPPDAPDYGGAIGVDADGVVNGVDVTMPTLVFAETKSFGKVDARYIKTLSGLTGKTNSRPFKGFARGEVLFLGASGGRRGDGDWEISFKFSVSPNETGLDVGGISVAEKKGWDYAWVRYEDAVDGNAVTRKPAAVYVERVYDEADFGTLGI